MDGTNSNTEIACTLTSKAQRAERARFRAELLPRMTGRKKLSSGAQISFDAAPGVCEDIERLVELDSACCKFLTHVIDENNGIIRLTTMGEGAGKELARSFYDEFRPSSPHHSGNLPLIALALCGLVCSAPLFIGAFGVGIAGVSLGGLSAVVVAVAMAVAGYIYRTKKRVAMTGRDKHADRCGC